MESLTEDGDVVEARKMGNQKSHSSSRHGVWLWSRQPVFTATPDVQVTAQSPAACLTARTELGFPWGHVKNMIPLQDEARHLWAADQRSWTLPAITGWYSCNEKRHGGILRLLPAKGTWIVECWVTQITEAARTHSSRQSKLRSTPKLYAVKWIKSFST